MPAKVGCIVEPLSMEWGLHVTYVLLPSVLLELGSTGELAGTCLVTRTDYPYHIFSQCSLPVQLEFLCPSICAVNLH
jgi:hypothetical protein